MFYPGSLQNGIALALQESKVVVCFIASANEQSKQWENEYLRDEEIIAHLAAQAIVLRMDSSSQEAGYLAAFYPISTWPTIVVINNGQLLADIHGSIPQHEFKAILIKAINGRIYEATAVPTLQTTGHTGVGLPSDSNVPMLHHGRNPASVDPAIQTLSNERRRRFEVDKKEKEAARKAQQQAKKEAVQAEAEATPDSRRARQFTYAQQQKKRQIDEQQERERILRVIENDKLERKHKQDMRKALSQIENETNDEPDALEDRQVSGAFILPDRCAVQVRLFNGSTIRSSFHSNETLGASVRGWIDRTRTDGETPYTLKQILAPGPSRSITISEEVGSLKSLGFTPSATLIMVPIREYVAAYDTSEGYLSSGVSAGYRAVCGGLNWISGAVRSFIGVARNPSHSTRAVPATFPRIDERQIGPRTGINIRSLSDHQTSIDEQQFYNGNQLNFEPRKEDDKQENESHMYNI